jgi:hypothetical protein
MTNGAVVLRLTNGRILLANPLPSSKIDILRSTFLHRISQVPLSSKKPYTGVKFTVLRSSPTVAHELAITTAHVPTSLYLQRGVDRGRMVGR